MRLLSDAFVTAGMKVAAKGRGWVVFQENSHYLLLKENFGETYKAEIRSVKEEDIVSLLETIIGEAEKPIFIFVCDDYVEFVDAEENKIAQITLELLSKLPFCCRCFAAFSGENIVHDEDGLPFCRPCADDWLRG